jgi:DNA-binding response OmpR family regulator
MELSPNGESGYRAIEEEGLESRCPSSVVPSRVSGWNPNCSHLRLPLKRLLVVDDDADIHMMLGDRLQAMGYVVLRANNGAEALIVLAMIPVVGVLLDLEMPVMDGLTFLVELQQQHIPVPVMVMSAGKDREKFLKAIQLGAMDYMEKPLDPMLLAQKCFHLFE